MGRRKILETVTLQSGGSYTGWSASGVCSREVLQQKFDQALTETRATTLYAETTECHIKRMEKFWTESVLFYPHTLGTLLMRAGIVLSSLLNLARH
jgi:hypothetical protein